MNKSTDPKNIMNENPFSNAGNTAVASAAEDLRAAASDFAKTTGEQAVNVKERALEAAGALKASAVQKAGQFKTVAVEKADHFKTVAAEKAAHVREVAQQQWDDTRVKAKEIHVTTEDYIRQNPTKSVLGALGVGFLIGLIVRR
jgi:ElaB/YqjD/DUF883 family membrane-anchored ribosome-binding protein